MSDRIETSTVEQRHADEPYCYVTTIGRSSGQPHEVEIWFAAVGNTIFLMNGGNGAPAGQADWVQNLQNDPVVTVRIADRQYRGSARMVEFDSEEHERMRDMLLGKYQSQAEGDLSNWRATAVPVAIDVMRE